jgi:hypothetical protein
VTPCGQVDIHFSLSLSSRYKSHRVNPRKDTAGSKRKTQYNKAALKLIISSTSTNVLTPIPITTLRPKQIRYDALVYIVTQLSFGYERFRSLVVRVPGYTTEMYCASCEVRTELMYVM